MITKIINELNNSISTNLSPWEMLRLWNIFKNVNHSQIISKVLSDAPNSFLVAGRGQDGAFILMPRSGNFTDIQNFVKNIFSKNLNNTPSLSASPTISDQANVVILNGTWINGLASKNAVLLEQAKFKILKIANAPTRNNSLTYVYDLTNGSKNNDLSILKKITSASQATDSPSWLSNYTNINSSSNSNTASSIATGSQSVFGSKPVKTDFIILLGTDSNKAQ